MNSLIPQPQNTNFLQKTKFAITFPRISNTTFFCQEVNLPGVSLSELPQTTPFVDLYKPGNKIKYETLSIKFIVDEDLRSWMEIHDWIKGMTFPNDFQQYNNLKTLSSVSIATKYPQYADGTLTILSNMNNPKMSIEFADLFPVSLSSIDFTSMDESTTTITATCSFRFAFYNVVRK